MVKSLWMLYAAMAASASNKVYESLHDFKPQKHRSKRRALPNGKRVAVRTEPKIGRNELCHCGSSKKYKKCCIIEPKVEKQGKNYL
jgi:uncharacterized protein YchJ